jgi:choline dehydrogenase
MDAYLAAAEEAGHKHNDDFNGDSQDGVGYYQLTQRGGMRCSVAVAYLHPVMNRPNLSELTETHADREVIPSAGAYNSPQLLMLFRRRGGYRTTGLRHRAASRPAGG